MRFCIKPALSYYRRKIILNLHKRYTSLNSHIAYANCSAAATLRRKKAKVKVALEGAVVFLSAHAPNLTYEDLKDRLENFKQIMPGQRSSNTRTDPQQQMKDLKMKYYRELKKLYELE